MTPIPKHARHVAFGDSAGVLGAIKVGDGDPAAYVPRLNCGEGGRPPARIGSVIVGRRRMSSVISACSAVANDPGERVRAATIWCGSESNAAGVAGRVGARRGRLGPGG